MPLNKKSIAIVGGGLLGRFLALELFERGESVALFDKGSGDGSSSCGYVGLGMVSPWSELPHLPLDDTITLKLGLSSLALWPTFLDKIGASAPYLTKGCLILSRREETAMLKNLQKLIDNSSFPSGYVEVCSDRAFPRGNITSIFQYEPEISANFSQGIFLPKEGCLDTRSLFASLTNHFSKIQLPTFYNCGECLIKNENEIFIPAFNENQKFDFVVDTRGLGAKTWQTNLRGVRGEALRVFAPQVNITRQVRIFDSKLPLYIAPRGDSVYTLGATCIESESSKPIAARSVLELLSMARYVHEGFMESSILETHVQWRPAYSDNKPKIILKKNFMSVNGLYRHGIMCVPALSVLCADLIVKKKNDNFMEMIYEN